MQYSMSRDSDASYGTASCIELRLRLATSIRTSQQFAEAGVMELQNRSRVEDETAS